LGRAGNPKILKEDGHEYVAPSANSSRGVPRPLTKEEITEYINLYARAAENAMRAGFDGVEIHR
jgi:NADPH2 dehydrogenase